MTWTGFWLCVGLYAAFIGLTTIYGVQALNKHSIGPY